MLNTLKIENFTVFKEADLQFSPGLNVIVGENGTGKSHLLKLGYAVLRAVHVPENELSRYNVVTPLENTLKSIFGISEYRDLIANKNGKCFLSSQWGARGLLDFYFEHYGIKTYIEMKKIIYNLNGSNENSNKNDRFIHIKKMNNEVVKKRLLFIPPKEILSIFNGFRSTLANRELDFDGTYLDLANALDIPQYKGKALERVKILYSAVENIINSEAVLNNGNFYFQNINSAGKNTLSDQAIKAHMMAEGHRKLGMLSYLIKNGSLEPGSSLFWDEPEANLNPKLLVALAQVLVELSKVMQITIATHSLFLLRELEILQEEKKLKKVRYFGLHLGEDGVRVEQGNTSNDIGDITALDASIEQSTRYLQHAYTE